MSRYGVFISCALLLLVFGDDTSYKECKDNDCSGAGIDRQQSVVKIIDAALDDAIKKMKDADAKTS